MFTNAPMVKSGLWPLVCMDKINKQQLKDKRASIPISPGNPMKFDTEYERNGSSNIFLSFEPLAGKRKLKVTDHRKKNRLGPFYQRAGGRRLSGC